MVKNNVMALNTVPVYTSDITRTFIFIVTIIKLLHLFFNMDLDSKLWKHPVELKKKEKI